MSARENDPMDIMEKEQQKIEVKCIAPNGLGFGHGGIKVEKQIEEGILTEEAPRVIHEVLTEDPEAFKRVEADDDGCGDGRPWFEIVQLVLDEYGNKVPVRYHKSRLRAKVFGGGLVTIASMWRTWKGKPKEDETVGKDRAFMAAGLLRHNISHGAHTDSHAHDDKCGCGAIDNYPEITANVMRYRTEIIETLRTIYEGDEFAANEEVIEQALQVYESLSLSMRLAKGISSMQAANNRWSRSLTPEPSSRGYKISISRKLSFLTT